MKVILVITSAYYGTAFYSPPLDKDVCLALKARLEAFERSQPGPKTTVYRDCVPAAEQGGLK